MNYSYGTLHITGSPAAIDKHQVDIIRHTLTVLYRTYRYAARCADDFRVVRQRPHYLTIHFSTSEGCVPAALVRVNDVLINDAEVIDEASFTASMASELNISHIVPDPDRAVRFALLPGAPAVCIAEPHFRVIFRVVEYLNAAPTTGKYEKGAVPEARLSHLIAGSREFHALMSAADDYEQSPYDIDFVLRTDDHLVEICQIASKARWQCNAEVAALVRGLGTEDTSTLMALPGATLVTTLESLRALVPAGQCPVTIQSTASDDRLVTFLTWADESWEYAREHGYFVVQTGSGRGDVYHPPVTRDEFVEAVIKLNNCMATRTIQKAGDGYPQQFDCVGIDAEVRAEVVGQEVSATDTPDGIGDQCGLEEL